MRGKPIVAAVSGVKNSGKTTLMEKLIRELSRRKNLSMARVAQYLTEALGGEA